MGYGEMRREKAEREVETERRMGTHLDLCGCVRLPGSSKVQAEFDVRHDWHGWPSSHLIRRRLNEGGWRGVGGGGQPYQRLWRTKARVARCVLTDNGRMPCITEITSPYTTMSLVSLRSDARVCCA